MAQQEPPEKRLKASLEQAPVPLSKWVEENSKYFVPPVCNKMMHGGGDLKVMFVGGPNIRKDFHIEEGEEIFWQLKGDMVLKIVEQGQAVDVVIKEGEIFMLPARVPHSPQRQADTVGLVIERERREEGEGRRQEWDCLRYYVDDTCKEVLWERWFYCHDLGSQLGPVIKEYFASEAHKTRIPEPGSVGDSKFNLNESALPRQPLPLVDFITQGRKEQTGKPVPLIADDEFNVVALYEDVDRWELDRETYVWQYEGVANLVKGGVEMSLETGAVALCGSGDVLKPQGVTLLVYIVPRAT